MGGSGKLQLWKEAVRGKSRGRCYGIAKMVVNVTYRVSFLIQMIVTNPSRSEVESQAIEAARAEAALANARADEAKTGCIS